MAAPAAAKAGTPPATGSLPDELDPDQRAAATADGPLLIIAGPGTGPLIAADAAEERRLLFVGMTRARDRLLLTCSARRTRHGSEEAAGRSPFLAAIDPELLGQATTQRARETGDRQLRLL